MKRQKKKRARNPKPIRNGTAPVTNRRVRNEPLKPARSVSYQRTQEYAQDDAPADADPLETRSALAQLLDIAGPEDVSGFDE